MPNLSLGTIEVLGLPAAVEAADVALKTADVTLIGYETTDGMGMVAVKIQGQVSAVQSAVSAACAAASRISRVFATSVIPRPSDQLEPVVLTDVTVGLERPAAPPVEQQPLVEPVETAPAQPLVEPPAQPLVEPVETPVSTSSTSDGGEPVETPPAQPLVEPVETPVSTSSTSDGGEPVETPPAQPLVEPVETPVSTSSTSDGGEPVETPPAVSTLRQAQGRPSSTSGGDEPVETPVPKPRTRKPSTTRTKK